MTLLGSLSAFLSHLAYFKYTDITCKPCRTSPLPSQSQAVPLVPGHLEILILEYAMFPSSTGLSAMWLILSWNALLPIFAS